MFIGRERELKLLRNQLDKRIASMVVIRGRRRIGKSRLVEQFSKETKIKTFLFSGVLPVAGTTAQSQRDEFARQMEEHGIPGVKADDWGTLFWHLAAHTKEGRVLILLDEISWMGTKDFDFLGKLKNAWDLHLKKNSKLLLILCGSVSSWIEEEILRNPAFLGRVSLRIRLDELPLYRCNAFWATQAEQVSSYDKLKLLSVTGGVPRYLEEIRPKVPAETNIRELCFQKEGLLFEEFRNIFSDLFGRKSETYEKIVRTLVNGSCDLNTLYSRMGVEKSGKLGKQLNELVLAGFVARDYTWNLRSGKESKLSLYRLKDNYLRFYLKWIEPNINRIERDEFTDISLRSLPGWDTILGLQFENLVLKNRIKVQDLLEIPAQDIVCNNPFFQSKTKAQPGCQIDYMIQTRHEFLYVCEIKFSRNPVGMDVVSAVKEKIRLLKRPKHMSCLSVLVHVGGVTDEVVDCGYFAKIIDFTQLFEL